MPSELIELTGEAEYVHLFEHNRDPGSTKGVNGAMYDYPEATSVDLHVEAEEYDKLKVAFPTYKDDPSEKGMRVKFKRTWVNEYRAEAGGCASIVDADDNPWDHSVPIGNGSKLTVYAEVYPSKAPRGYSMRMLGVKVLELVEPELPPAPKLPWEA